MNLAQVTEYQVQVFRFKTEKKLKWKAQVIAFPQFTAEGNSREAVLEEIKDQLSTLEAESEIISIPVQSQKEVALETAPPIDEELDAKLKAMGYKYYGAFADDPGALEYFNKLPVSHQNYYSKWIESAKTDFTKAKRIALTINACSKKMSFSQMMQQQKRMADQSSTSK